MPSNHLITCHPLLLLPSIFPGIRVFSNESALHIRWLKYWSFSFNISPSNEHPELISFRMDWLDLLAIQGTLKSLLQHNSSKASIFLCSAFFIVLPSSTEVLNPSKSYMRIRAGTNCFQTSVNVDILSSSYEALVFLMTSRMVNPFQKVFNLFCPDSSEE